MKNTDNYTGVKVNVISYGIKAGDFDNTPWTPDYRVPKFGMII